MLDQVIRKPQLLTQALCTCGTHCSVCAVCLWGLGTHRDEARWLGLLGCLASDQWAPERGSLGAAQGMPYEERPKGGDTGLSQDFPLSGSLLAFFLGRR